MSKRKGETLQEYRVRSALAKRAARALRRDPEVTRQKMLAASVPGYSNRKWKLKGLYGITPDQFDERLNRQGGGCAICGGPSSSVGKSLSVDHDHGDGSIRGILCNGCNLGLGHFDDSPDKLMSAAAYLLARVDILGKVG